MSIEVIANTQQIHVDVETRTVVVTPFGGGGGAVASVDGRTGVVTLDDLYVEAGSLAPVATSGDYTDLANAPDVSNLVATSDPRLSDDRTPLAHSHAQSDVTGLVSALAGIPDPTSVTAGKVWTADGANGADWQAGGGSQVWTNGPFYPSAVGEYIGTPMNAFTASAISTNMANSCSGNRVAMLPVYRSVRVDDVSIRVSTAATDPDAVFQIGVCPADPDTLLPDFASMLGIVTVDATVKAKQTAAISGGWALTRGLWFVVVGLVSPTSKTGTNPQIYITRQYSMAVPARSALDNAAVSVSGIRAVADTDIDTATVSWVTSSNGQEGPMAVFKIGAIL